MRIAVAKETSLNERRVALVPEVVRRLIKDGHQVLIEKGAGETAFFPDEQYREAGAELVASAKEAFSGAELVLKVQPPGTEEIAEMRSGQAVAGFMAPHRVMDRIEVMQKAGITVFAVELIPRISRAQSMDALSSQATVAGYKAALIAADTTHRFFPMLTTAAGTIRPAKVLVLGAGVAGLMAIATARRLGALVEAYDVRRAAGEQVRSLGAKFLELQIDAEAEGGYARELTEQEKEQERAMVAAAVAQADAVITTANIPGRSAPRLVSADMVQAMRPGSIIVDLAAETGGNCELTQAGQTVNEGGVVIAGPLNVPSMLAVHASEMYARNLQSFSGLLVGEGGAYAPDWEDEIIKGSALMRDGEVLHGPTLKLLKQGDTE